MPQYYTPIDTFLLNRQTQQMPNTSVYHVSYNRHNLYDDHTPYPVYPNTQLTFNMASSVIDQPNTIRWRHRYNGVRESLKTNQEIGQYYYDIRVIDTRYDGINRFLQVLLDDVDSGISFQQLQTNWGQNVFSVYVPISIDGMADNITILERLRHRVRDLEARNG